ncbi:M20/M25/M40 family metallo-hydrolase [Virgibacillus pantothenticus]|uniref:M20/M25/M40 family metallo-hydrolase n=1 Tax=Virgibacillus TaxID=84406 RepID=UPI0009098507|nr:MULTISPECIES: M20/M25/M40 family metallo-hydrolase [Virgibacillus]API92592.1 peptidase M20 [Virgibacillus sp. 6R]MBS7428080.1 M20/M25/M40 family metallo-hydrolase [Virgibacillus sp. 19R1-5]MBU8565408.1 M20/M25/M40 family metallo-hydrolase [Virgibacillus pantothenticus]MBU8599373.1 M20/M25/M40 family metallo-hydrolase [Virgibacillus pantothenticus]MBU8633727.1 M20/M25/M40 family metallo-hydrolase [Virgibacillus pantothenticus]
MLDCREEILHLTKQFVQIESVVNTDGEKTLASSLYSIISSYHYFREHTDQVILQPTANDHMERYNVLAFIKGTKGQSNRTVILMGHLDTVDTFDFQHLQNEACSPEALMTRLQHEPLPPSVKAHLDSEDWLFGRGVLDMKSGLASHLYLLKYYANHPEELDGNLVFLAACDEEDSSHGVLSALAILKELQTKQGFDYAAAINADFVSPAFAGDENRYIYKGTVGKLLPTFLITGAETHVGSCFEGLDPNFIVSELTSQINYNPELCDEAYGEVTPPPVTLKQSDLKPTYTTQTALAAYVYYNFFTHSWSPKEVLEKLKTEAYIAFERAVTKLEQSFQQYGEKRGEAVSTLGWQPRVLTYNEMQELLIEEHGEAFIQHMQAFKNFLLQQEDLDTRLFSVYVVEEAWKWLKDKAPAIILFYSSLYSPRVDLSEENEKEAALLTAMEQAVIEVQPNYPHPIESRHFFPHISDMSFLAIRDSKEDIQAVIDNNPGWGTKHKVSYEDIRELNVPVINIGPYGMDAHKSLERVEMTYSFEIVPNLTKRVIELLGMRS